MNKSGKRSVLLITGQNNHDWKRSSQFCGKLMQDSGAFDVTTCLDPAAALSANQPAKYDLFFVDYNGPAWSEPAKKNFVDAVKNGTGVLILHAANNGFTGWVEFEEMCALMWREGTGHGAYHNFDVKITDPNHPITKGLPPVLKNHPDELYHRLVHMHNTPFKTIATAFSSGESNGTGRDEPALIVKNYGKGNVVHCILGHVWGGGCMDTFNNPDFQKLLLRSCQWAAGSEVTL